MPYELFVSYSRRDNRAERVTQFVEHVADDFRRFTGADLRCFFDRNAIHGMDDWRQKIQRGLRESQLFIAVLSPAYLASPYCRWEWEDYVRYEAMRQCLGEGVAPVFFVTLPDTTDPLNDRDASRWLDEIKRRQTFDLRPWYGDGEKALQQAHVRETLEKLHASVRERLGRAGRAKRSPSNLLRHNPWFVGRIRELTEVRQALMKNKLGVVGAGQPSGLAAVQGVGGMGKTELALAYAHAFAWDYPGGRWRLGCEHVGDLRVAMLQLAGPMGFEFTEDESKSLALGFERVLRELNRRERCLLVLDNVNLPNLLEPEQLDRLPRDGQVDLIATTRLAPMNIPGSAQNHTFIPVDELPEDDAVALLRSHQSSGRFLDQAEDDEARAVARLLEGFTLAVETAAIYLGRHADPGACRAYRERLQSELLATSEKAAGDPTVAVRHRERLLGRTLAFTFETLPAEAIRLLTLAAILPADAIGLPWLEAVSDLSPFRPTVDLLLGMRLFQASDVSDAQGVLLVAHIHRLVQEEIQRRWPEDLDTLEQVILAHLRSRSKFLWNGWIDHANRWELNPIVAVADHWLNRDGDDGPFLASNAAGPLKDLGRFSDAERLLRASLTRSKDRRSYAITSNNLADLLRETNRAAEAEPLQRRAVTIIEASLGSDHADVAASLGGLAELLSHTNRKAEAEPLLRRALAITERSHGPDHTDVAIALNNLANLLNATNRMGEAEPLYHRALMIWESSLGPDHTDVAIALNNLAELLNATNRRVEAEPLYRRALAIWESTLGPDHPTYATAINNLAGLLYATNRGAEAEPLFRRALAIDERSLGPDHPAVALRLNNLVKLLRDTNRLSEAEPLVRRALAINERSLGPDHPDVARDLINLANLFRETSRPSEAEPLFRRALAIDERSHGPDHPAIAIALNDLAGLLRATNRPSEAEPLYRRALAINERSLGPDHPEVAGALNNLALLISKSRRGAEAEPLFRRALAIWESSLSPYHPNVASALINLAGVLRANEAEALYRRALAIQERTLGSDHPDVAVALNALANLLLATDRAAEAEPLSRRMLAIFLEFADATRHDHPHLRTAISNYVEILRALGQSRADIVARLDEIGRPFGISFGG